MARSSAYSLELATEVATRVALGASLKAVSELRGMPSMRTLIRWTAEHPEFDLMLAHARCTKADMYVEEVIAISDEPVQTLADAARNRVRVQARLQVAEKFAPRRYGAKLGIGGAQDLPPIETKALSDNDAARRVLFAVREALETLKALQAANSPPVLVVP